MRKPTHQELDLLHDNLCSALNDKTRIAILFELADGPQHVGQIVASLELPQATVSRHLKVLREGTILLATRNGNRVVYEIQDVRILEVLSLLRRIHADAMRRRSEMVSGVRSSPAGVRTPRERRR